MSLKKFFDDNGYITVENLIPQDLIEDYKKYWLTNHAPQYDGTVNSMTNKMGWKESNPFIKHKKILDILCHKNIYNIFNQLDLSLMGLHLSFTPWYSTQKRWHQDYIEDDLISSENYIGVWIALDDIDVEAGPFGFVPTSHKWKIDYSIYRPENVEQMVAYFPEQIKAHKIEPLVFVPKSGSALFWHGHLIHCGTDPKDVNKPRPSLIGHYSSASRGNGMGQIDMHRPYSDGHYIDNVNIIENLYS